MNYHKFEEKLLELLVCAEYEKDNPINVNTCTHESIHAIPNKAKEYYLTNINFRARIDYLVSNIVKLTKEDEIDRCPECDFPLITKMSSVRCSKCDYWCCI